MTMTRKIQRHPGAGTHYFYCRSIQKIICDGEIRRLPGVSRARFLDFGPLDRSPKHVFLILLESGAHVYIFFYIPLWFF